MQKSINDIIQDYYKIAIPYVNGRTTASFYDGLKDAQRRTIFTMSKIASKHTVKVGTIAGECMAHYHPHGDASIVDVVVDLVNKGILNGQGNFGACYLYNKDSDHAAPRYIEASMTKTLNEMINKLLKYAPMIESEADGSLMPSRLILPIPIGAITGVRGIGMGSNNNIPAFTAKSLLSAMLADDPSLLKSTFDAEIIPEKSALSKIWTKGHGKITYKMKVYRGEYSGLKGVFMEGNPMLFGKVDLTPFKKAKSEGLVVIKDTGTRLFIGKQYKVRKIDVDWILKQAESVSEISEVYMITLLKDGVVGRSPLKYWIQSVYDEYIQYYSKYISDEIKSRRREVFLLEHLNEIGQMLIDKKSSNYILSHIEDLTEGMLKDAKSKSLGMLEKDHTPTIKKLNSEIKDLQDINVTAEVQRMINAL